jgi:hypothetical protein
MKTLKILGVHGLGDHRTSTWKRDWQDALTAAFPGQDAIKLEFTFLTYDDIFEGVDLSVWQTMQAVWKLSRSAISGVVRRHRGVVEDVSDRVRWTAGYVVAWVEHEGFQTKTRKRVLETVARERPDLILAHSLGSLVTYNAFSHPDASKAEIAGPLSSARYITLGSQLGNPFVVGNLTPGRVERLPVRSWHHLYNKEDDVFTAPIRLFDMPEFKQVETPFDVEGFADHSAVEYLKHRGTVSGVWRPIAETRINARAFGSSRQAHRRESAAVLARQGRLTKRALLVGINQYPSEEDRLEGCVNDVFLMSSALQECGFEPESIRVCLDDRATAKGIKERLKWLLDDPRKGDERVFYYSGHGARIPQYGDDFEPDRKVETLVPYDFDWSIEKAIADDEIYALYSQLPYDMQFAMILDCCHSGGMHRHGGARVRGLNPPDDVRHRELRWDQAADMWVERDFKPLNRQFSSQASVNDAFFGNDRSTTRLGRASLIRQQGEDDYKRLKRREGSPKVGPYLPLIIEACQEKEFSYEYRHGVTSYGAFTYSLCLELRKRKRISFQRLVEVTADRLKALGYEQKPQILGPKAIVSARVPWSE